MSEHLAADILRPSRRFFRSVDLVRDFEDPEGLAGYWLTDFACSCLEQISDSFRKGSTKRAWRLTGDFGSGKSSFALLLANSVRESRRRLPKPIQSPVFKHFPAAKTTNYLPVLVTGSREPIATAIVRALHQALSALSTRGAKSSLLVDMERNIARKRISDKKALEFLEEAKIATIRAGKSDGILLILDEVGKFLEFAALRPQEQDVYFLQQLAETACRSGKYPMVIVCLLHQGLSSYAEELAKCSGREWEKIAGRFEEISFRVPLDQIARLTTRALDLRVDKLSKSQRLQARESMEKAIALGWYGTSSSRDALRSVAEDLFPIDPLVLPVMVRLFRRYGQNERSLFGFLQSHEPFGLQAFLQRAFDGSFQPFRIADLYDYARANFGHQLSTASFKAHWSVIESTIESFPSKDPLTLAAMKTVGLLNLLNAEDLLPTAEAVSWAVAGDSAQLRDGVELALNEHSKTTRLYFRGEGRGYSVWPHTSVDIDSRVQEARQAVHSAGSISEAINELLPSEPIVARGHYIQTGNLRYFDVVYCQPEELAEKASNFQTRADGFILIPLCETPAQAKECEAAAQTLASEPRTDLIRVIAVPRPLSRLGGFVLEAKRWAWIRANTKELNNDPLARDEVALHLREAESKLHQEVQSMLGRIRHSGTSSLRWYYRDHEGRGDGEQLTSKGTLALLSQLCDHAFPKAPQIKNELVNRHGLSSAAAAARMRLVDLMFSASDKQDLGLPPDRKPPEKSMYLSVLRRTGLHREIAGRWCLATPETSRDDSANVRPALKEIKDILSKRPDCRVQIRDIMEVLRRPPYGVRGGLFPILLAVVAIEGQQEIAFYENGTFLREVGKDAFLRMTKVPEKFEVQYCKIEGVRSQLFQQLARVLELSEPEKRELELLDVVRNLCQFVAQLPEYVRQTSRLDNPKALAVRDVILQAREPVRMVFHDLPGACGFEKYEIGTPTPAERTLEFVSALKAALDELRSAFPNLHRRMGTSLAKEFGYGELPLSQFRRKLAARAEDLLLQVTENKLKAFAFRLFDEGLSESDWLNSVGSVLALRPPDKWKDEDEETFHRELEAASGRFKRAESVAFARDSHRTGGRSLRVAITQADGQERQEVIHVDENEESQLFELETQIADLIRQNDRLGLAAASRVIWDQLKTAGEES